MSKTILVVDDSATMVMSLKASLEIAGFKVETANDGVQALAKLKSGVKPDLIITDINMPTWAGWISSATPVPCRGCVSRPSWR
jgi:two-component system chemotaxis response regulator CheY